MDISLSCFGVQYLIVFVVLLLLTNISCSFHCLINGTGIAIVIGTLSWHFSRYIRRNYINKDNFHSSLSKAVLITGCDSGFGHRLANKLNTHGFTVYAACLNPSGPGPLQLLSNARFPNKTKLLKMDVTNESEINAAYEEIRMDLEKNNEQLWAVVNNAGIGTVTPFIESGTMESYKRIFDVNTFGVVRVTRVFLPLIRNSKGRIVNIASCLGRVTMKEVTSYCMSKYAVISFSDALRRDMHQWGVKVITIEPELYKTPIADKNLVGAGYDKEMRETAPEIQKVYGEKYLEAVKDNGIQIVERFQRENVDEVVDDLIDAVRNKHPQIRYTPGGFIGRTALIILEYINSEVSDMLYAIISKINKKPQILSEFS